VAPAWAGGARPEPARARPGRPGWRWPGRRRPAPGRTGAAGRRRIEDAADRGRTQREDGLRTGAAGDLAKKKIEGTTDPTGSSGSVEEYKCFFYVRRTGCQPDKHKNFYVLQVVSLIEEYRVFLARKLYISVFKSMNIF
jgi:hypothetical protein